MKKQKYDSSNNLNGTLFEPVTTWKTPTAFPCLDRVTKIGIDTETRDPRLSELGPGFIRGDAEVAGVSIATADKSWYFPIGHFGGGNMDRNAVISWLTDLLARSDLRVYGANLAYDLESLASLDIHVAGQLYDVQVCDALIDEERELGYGLNALCDTYLKKRKDETLLRDAASAYGVDPKSGLWKLPAKYVGPYAEYDAFCVLKIADCQAKIIQEQSLERVVDLEMAVLPVLHAMRLQGVKIDLEKANALSKRLLQEEEKLRIQIKTDFGRLVDEWSGPQIASMADALHLRYPRTGEGNPSFVSDWLQAQDHPFFESIFALRELNKLRNSFVDGSIIKHNIRGRIHCQWKQLVNGEGGTKTGRMAAANPNFQQIPASKKRSGKPNTVGAEIRSLCIPDTGRWAKIDYSQQEPRILVHFAAMSQMGGAEAAAFAFRANPDMSYYQMMMDIATCEKRVAKTMHLGLCYGMGVKKLADSLGMPKDEAEKVISDFNNKIPFIKEMAEKCQELGLKRGYVRTLYGRRRHFNYWEPTNVWDLREENKHLPADRKHDLKPVRLEIAEQKWKGQMLQRVDARKALNAVIQGSAADMMKASLVKIYDTGRIPYLTVHDEVDLEVADEKDGLEVKHIMETSVKMCVPVRGELEIGDHWK